ncbi:MAG: hypothetical protein J3K34DRAFT_437434 [Monoraphidium minutum]|nr:MAG: hypothetical protein J3K34DRAFT_437434 [Monoraphidium minutum]
MRVERGRAGGVATLTPIDYRAALDQQGEPRAEVAVRPGDLQAGVGLLQHTQVPDVVHAARLGADEAHVRAYMVGGKVLGDVEDGELLGGDPRRLLDGHHGAHDGHHAEAGCVLGPPQLGGVLLVLRVYQVFLAGRHALGHALHLTRDERHKVVFVCQAAGPRPLDGRRSCVGGVAEVRPAKHGRVDADRVRHAARLRPLDDALRQQLRHGGAEGDAGKVHVLHAARAAGRAQHSTSFSSANGRPQLLEDLKESQVNPAGVEAAGEVGPGEGLFLDSLVLEIAHPRLCRCLGSRSPSGPWRRPSGAGWP